MKNLLFGLYLPLLLFGLFVLSVPLSIVLADKKEVVEGEYIVVLKDNQDSVAISAEAKNNPKIKVKHTYKSALKGYTATIPADELEKVKKDPRVLYVVENQVVSASVGDGLKGEYFDTYSFSNHRLTRVDSQVDFNWGSGSPATNIASDTFSVRWTGQILIPETAAYTFYTLTDDGVKLWVNDQLIINRWANQSATERSGTINLVGGQKYNIKMEYYEGNFNALAQLSWSTQTNAKQVIPQTYLYSQTTPNPTPTSSPTQAPTPTPTLTPTPTPVPTPSPTPPPSQGTGLKGTYFVTKFLGAIGHTRVDPQINFNWGNGSPIPGTVPADNFSVRWVGEIKTPNISGNYTFYTKSDDGVRVWVNNVLVIDRWDPHNQYSEQSGLINLASNQKYPIKVEYYDGWGSAVIELRWSAVGLSKQIIPSGNLFPSNQEMPTGIDRVDAELNPNEGTGIVVAVLDTGVELNHPDLQANIIANHTCVSGTTTGNDDHGHGTHVAGTIAALNNDQGVIGVASEAKIIAVKVLGSNSFGTWADVICGIDWITANASTYNIKVANMSLGSAGLSDNNCGTVSLDPAHQAICRSRDAGITYVVAAMNEASDATGYIPASYDDAVITVSALSDFDGRAGGLRGGADDTFAGFSNFGNPVDLGAPGFDIYSTMLNGSYGFLSGTSMASPHVAGAAALYLKSHPFANWLEIRNALINSAEPLGNGHTDPSGLHPEPVLKVNNL